MRKETVPAAHFCELYAVRPDPWHLGDSDYEKAKYAATLAALPREHYRTAFEIGCANGDFTALLAARCNDLLAVEPVNAALDVARRANAARPWVRFAPLFVPQDWPDESFDLVVISEVIDYLGRDDVETLSRRVCASLRPAGDVVLVHWVGKKSGPPSGREATDVFIACAQGALKLLHEERNADYRLDVLRLDA